MEVLAEAESRTPNPESLTPSPEPRVTNPVPRIANLEYNHRASTTIEIRPSGGAAGGRGKRGEQLS